MNFAVEILINLQTLEFVYNKYKAIFMP